MASNIKGKTALITNGASDIGFSCAQELLRNDTRADMHIEGKIVIVTGGANGIGYCTVRKLLMNGAKAVAMLDLADSGGEGAVTELQNEFGKDRVMFIGCDVSKSDDLKEAFKNVIDTFDGLDIVFNNAGVMDDADWEPMIDTNVKGVIRGTILALNHMARFKGGSGGTVVNMSSITGLQSTPLAPIFSATTQAVLGFTAGVKYHYEKTGVRMLTICPGLTATSLAAKFMASKAHAMDMVDDEFAAEEMIKYQKQSPEHVAAAVIELIEKGENGAIFISENNQPPYAVQIPDYATFKVPE